MILFLLRTKEQSFFVKKIFRLYFLFAIYKNNHENCSFLFTLAELNY